MKQKDKIFKILLKRKEFNNLSTDRQGEMVVEIDEAVKAYEVFIGCKAGNFKRVVDDALTIKLSMEGL